MRQQVEVVGQLGTEEEGKKEEETEKGANAIRSVLLASALTNSCQ